MLLNILNKNLFRCCSTLKNSKSCSSNFAAIKLNHRRIVRLTGFDSIIYLQMLTTNDLRKILPFEHMYYSQNCIYSFLLNHLGRVLTDMFIYKGNLEVDNELLIEIDDPVSLALQRFLLAYRTKKIIQVDIASEYDVWSILPLSLEAATENSIEEIDSDDVKLIKDPRLFLMGYRLVTRISDESVSSIEKILNQELSPLDVSKYKTFRYKLGLVEGLEDIVSGSDFPFNFNADYVQGYSFHKGTHQKIF